MGIKTQKRGQVGELEILIHLDDDDMGFSLDRETPSPTCTDEDRKRVKQIMERARVRSPSKSTPPPLETIDEVGADPFGAFLSREELEEINGDELETSSTTTRRQGAKNAINRLHSRCCGLMSFKKGSMGHWSLPMRMNRSTLQRREVRPSTRRNMGSSRDVPTAMLGTPPRIRQ